MVGLACRNGGGSGSQYPELGRKTIGKRVGRAAFPFSCRRKRISARCADFPLRCLFISAQILRLDTVVLVARINVPAQLALPGSINVGSGRAPTWGPPLHTKTLPFKLLIKQYYYGAMLLDEG